MLLYDDDEVYVVVDANPWMVRSNVNIQSAFFESFTLCTMGFAFPVVNATLGQTPNVALFASDNKKVRHVEDVLDANSAAPLGAFFSFFGKRREGVPHSRSDVVRD